MFSPSWAEHRQPVSELELRPLALHRATSRLKCSTETSLYSDPGDDRDSFAEKYTLRSAGRADPETPQQFRHRGVQPCSKSAQRKTSVMKIELKLFSALQYCVGGLYLCLTVGSVEGEHCNALFTDSFSHGF